MASQWSIINRTLDGGAGTSSNVLSMEGHYLCREIEGVADRGTNWKRLRIAAIMGFEGSSSLTVPSASYWWAFGTSTTSQSISESGQTFIGRRQNNTLTYNAADGGYYSVVTNATKVIDGTLSDTSGNTTFYFGANNPIDRLWGMALLFTRNSITTGSYSVSHIIITGIITGSYFLEDFCNEWLESPINDTLTIGESYFQQSGYGTANNTLTINGIINDTPPFKYVYLQHGSQGRPLIVKYISARAFY